MGTYSKERLIKLLNLTASDNDHEALLALRNAQKMMALGTVTWESLVKAKSSASSRRQPTAPSSKSAPVRPPRETEDKAPPEPKGKAALTKFRWISQLFDFIFAQTLNSKQTEFFEGLRSSWVSFGTLTVRQQAALEQTCIAKGFTPKAA